MPSEPTICGVLLAGGQSRRMGGGDKCLAELAGKTLLRRTIEAAAPQVGPLVLNSNSDAALFDQYALPVVPDVIDGFAGPLAGILTGLDWAAENVSGCTWLASFACDAPFVPRDLVSRMIKAVRDEDADLACASSGGRNHPVFGLWPLRLRDDLRSAVVEEGVRKVDAWTGRYRLAVAAFETANGDPFFNINRPGDLADAVALLADRRGGQLTG